MRITPAAIPGRPNPKTAESLRLSSRYTIAETAKPPPQIIRMLEIMNLARDDLIRG
jgi:hypothetical protein